MSVAEQGRRFRCSLAAVMIRGKSIDRTLLLALVVFLAAAASAPGAQQTPKASKPVVPTP